MKIRKAEAKDIPRLLALLEQVLQIHAEIRPDIFISGTTKYTVCELAELLKQEDKPIYVAVNEDDVCMGYAFCQMKEQPFSTNMIPFKSLFIDDLCVDQQARGQHIGESLISCDRQVIVNDCILPLSHRHSSRSLTYELPPVGWCYGFSQVMLIACQQSV